MIRDCRVCVAGGAGFLGSHLVNHLIDDRNCEVVVLDNLCAGRREFVHSKARFVHCDITKSEAVMRAAMVGCKAAFNYAAWPYIPDSFARPLHVFEVNATGAIQFLNAAQEAGVERILQVSSAEIYGEGERLEARYYDTPEYQRINENTLVRPHSTYGVAKAAVDSYVQCAWKERRTPAIALRQFNCVGERETHPYVIPEIIGQLAKAQDKGIEEMRQGYAIPRTMATVHLGNNSFRDFLYAGDAVRIAVELLERGQFGEVYNLGSETGVRMYDLAKLIGREMGFADVNVIEDPVRKRPWEIWHLQSDNAKLYATVKDCGHEHCADDLKLTTLEEGIRRTVRWYEDNGRRWPWEGR